MDSRGQASAEYIFLILIFLIVLTTVTIPFAGNAISSSQNVSITSDAQTALSTIVNAIDVVYSNGPGARRTVNVYFPQNANLAYSTNVLSLSLQGIPVNASNPSTLKPNVNSSVPYALTITGGAVTKGWHDVTISWGVGNSTITIAIST
jgi:uncharacterized protein (UPF0333 family)